MKASVMMMSLMRVKADTSGVSEPPAPCSGQTFYRRAERRVNVESGVRCPPADVLFLKKYAEKGRAVPPFARPRD